MDLENWQQNYGEPWHYVYPNPGEHYWRYSDLKRVKDARNMANMRIAWRKIAGVFLDEATRLLNKMTDWLNARGKKWKLYGCLGGITTSC